MLISDVIFKTNCSASVDSLTRGRVVRAAADASRRRSLY